MKLGNKDLLLDYIEQCYDTVSQDTKNDFIGVLVTSDNESAIQQAMHEAGFHDFISQKSTWPSLFLSVDDFMERPYYKHIHFDNIQDGRIAFKKQTIPGGQLFNVEAILNDPDKALNESMTLRALDRDYETSVLTIDDETWMLDVYSEAFTIDPYAEMAHGKVATLGLGIGYYVYMALNNPRVESITVIEINPKIIDLFKKYIYPQFPQAKPVTIIQADAIQWFSKENLDHFDTVFVDTYQSSIDGYEMMEAMLKKTVPTVDHVQFWIENSCVDFIRLLILMVIEQRLLGLKIGHPDPLYNRVMKKVVRYLDASDIVIDSVEALQTLIYDPMCLRGIIGS